MYIKLIVVAVSGLDLVCVEDCFDMVTVYILRSYLAENKA